MNYVPTDDEASTLLDAVDTEADPTRRGEITTLLGNYKKAKTDAGLEPFAPNPEALREQREAFRGLYAGLDQVENKVPVAARADFMAALGAATDKNEFKARAINQAWVAAKYPQIQADIDADWAAVKRQVAIKEFGVYDDVDDNDVAFYRRVAAHLEKEKAENDMLSEALTEIRMEAGKGAPDWLGPWQKVSKALKTNTAWDEKHHDRYRKVAQKVFEDTKRELEPIRTAVQLGREYYKLVASGSAAGTGVDDGKGGVRPKTREELADDTAKVSQAYRGFLDELARLPKAQQEIALNFAIAGAVDVSAKPMGEEGAAGVLEKTAVSLERAIGAFPRNVARFGMQGVRAASESMLTARHAHFGAKDTPMASIYNERDNMQRAELARKIEAGLVDAVDPIKSKSRLAQGVYDAMESVPYMVAAGAGGAGIPLAIMAMAEDNRGRFVDNGVPEAEAATLALAAAVPQVAIERLQAHMVFPGKLPGFEKWLNKAVGTKIGLAKKMVAVGGIEVAQQNVEEAMQDIAVPVYQEIGAMLSDAVPDVKWLGKDGELSQFANSRADTFFALLPMVLIGTGTASFREAAFGREYLSNKTVLKAAGFTEVAAEQIAQTAAAGDIAQAQALVQAGWINPEVRPRAAKEKENADAKADLDSVGRFNTEEQQRAFEELDEQMRASWVEQADPQGARAIRQEDGSWVVVDREGVVVDQTADADQALQLVGDVDRAENARLVDVVDDTINWFKQRGRGGEIHKTGDIKTLADEVEAGRMTEEQAQRVVDLYVRLGNLPAGTQIDQARIYGESERRYNARTKVFEYVTRLHDGADPLVLVEEEAEGYFKAALDSGEITLEQVEEWQKAMGVVLPKYPDEKMRRRAGTEFFSKYAQAYITGKASADPALPRTFRRWLDKMREVFAEIFTLAKNLMELEDAGKLPGDFKTHLARSVGLDEAFLERRMREEERQAAKEAQGMPLLEWVKGRLPHPEGYAGTLAGEIRNIWEGLTTEVDVEGRGVDRMGEDGKIKKARKGYKRMSRSAANAFFAPKGQDVDLDQLREEAVAAGYEFDTPNDLLTAVDAAFAGRETYAWEKDRTMALRKKPDKTTDIFDSGLADEDFKLWGGEAVDSEGVVDREEARREAKKKADADQGELTFSLAQTKTPAFKAWFGDSKVVNPDGTPRVVYHGTAQDFKNFKHDGGWSAHGFYFSSNPAYASAFAALRGGGRDGDAVYPAYLRIEKPLDTTDVGLKRMNAEGFIEYLESKGFNMRNSPLAAQVLSNNTEDEKMPFWQWLRYNARYLVREAAAAGYDGIALNETGASDVDAGTVYFAFDSWQIKSATGNRGTFSRGTPDITMAIRAPDTEAFRAWFKDSKVVDYDGEPKVVFHGTDQNFSVPGRDERRQRVNEEGEGIWFSEGVQLAHPFVGGGRNGGGRVKVGSNIIPAFLSIQNPLDLSKDDVKAYMSLAELLTKAGIPAEQHLAALDELEAIAGPERDAWNKERRLPDTVAWHPVKGSASMSTANQTDAEILKDEDSIYRLVERDEVRQLLAKRGFDGIKARESIRYNEGAATGAPRVYRARDTKVEAVTWLPFTAGQIKSATGNRGTFDASNPDITMSVGTFYSRLNRAVEQSTQAKASGAQWKATIRNSKAGVNKDEFALAGVEDLEDGKVYTKDEVLEYLRANEVRVEDVVLGDEPDRDAIKDAVLRLRRAGFTVEHDHGVGETYITTRDNDGVGDEVSIADLPAELQADARLVTGVVRGGKPYFGDYTLPGAVEGSYREVLLTVPGMQSPKSYGEIERLQNGKFVVRAPGLQDALFDTWDDALNETLRLGKVFPHLATEKLPAGVSRKPKWEDGHSQYSRVQNPVVRLRLNERTAADGKSMLFLEEVQAPVRREFSKMPALFQKNWREMAFKWAIRQAAEKGVDMLGWTTGAQQAERYDLSKQIEGLSYYNRPGDGYTIKMLPKGRNAEWQLVATHIPAAEIEQHVGKEMAAKIIAGEGDVDERSGTTFLDNVDMKVGGEGLKQLYDQDFRSVVNGLPIVRKSGQKVATAKLMLHQDPHNLSDGRWVTVQLSYSGRWGIARAVSPDLLVDPQLTFATKDQAEGYAKKLMRLSKEASDVHAIAITPEMRAAAMEGQPTFSLRRAAPADSSKQVELADGARLVGPTSFAIRAYHGTPHKVDRFSTDKIGTGQGAQTYGWGLYFAENPSVAEAYRSSLSGKPKPQGITVDGQRLTDINLMDFPDNSREQRHGLWELQEMASRWNPDKVDVMAKVRADVNSFLEGRLATKAGQRDGQPDKNNDFRIMELTEAKKWLDSGRIGFAPKEDPGQFYAVDVLPNPDEFLHYDLPLSQQPPAVRAKLQPAIDKILAGHYKGKAYRQGDAVKYDARGAGMNVKGSEWTGDDLLNALRLNELYGQDMANPPAKTPAQTVSEYLRDLGVPGLRYLDEGSRSTAGIAAMELNLVIAQREMEEWQANKVWPKESAERQANNYREQIAFYRKELERLREIKPTHNLVIFDDKLVRILEENGRRVEPQAEVDGSTFALRRAEPIGDVETEEIAPGVEVAGPATFAIRAYHGSPHEVEQFKMEKIGTGEGSQAFGWGLYFAENIETAKVYQEKLRPMTEVVNLTVAGVPLYRRGVPVDYSPYQFTQKPTERDYGRALIQEDMLIAESAMRTAFDESGIDGVKKLMRELLNDRLERAREEDPPLVPYYEEVLARMDAGDRTTVEFKKGTSNMYVVDLMPDHEDFIQWDLPLAKQNERVKDVVRARLKELGFLRPKDNGPRVLQSAWHAYGLAHGGMTDKDSGRAVYEMLVKKAQDAKIPNPEKAASEEWLAAGIPGIRYWDNGSRGREAAKNKTHNFVMFDEKDVRIIEKNGQPVGDSTFAVGRDIQVTPEQERDYEQAVERGEKRKAQRMVADIAGYKPKSSDIDRGGAHSPADPESGAPAWDLTGSAIYPEDVYSLEGLRYYGTGQDAWDNQAWSILMNLEGRPTKLVTIYRAVEKDAPDRGIQPGAWVSIVRAYAVEHGRSALGGNYRIQEKVVHADEIYTAGDSWLEWGYHPQSALGRPWRDSRLRRGPGGPVIPLKERFNRELGESTASIGPMDRPERVREAIRVRAISIRVDESPNFAREVKKLVGKMEYNVRGMEVNEREARKIIDENDGDLVKLLRILNDPTQTMHPATKVALAFFMAEAANKAKNYGAAAEIAKQAAMEATAAGQGVNEFKRWSIFDQPETAQALLQGEVERENKRRKEREPAIEAVKVTYAEVQAEAYKLLKKWIDEINGFNAETAKPVDVAELPEVTFSLSAEQKATGIVKVVARMLKQSGAEATERALVEKYGENVKAHLTDLFIEAQKTLTGKKPGKEKKFKTRQPVLSDDAIERSIGMGRGKQEEQVDMTIADRMRDAGLSEEQIERTLDEFRNRQEQQLGLEGEEKPAGRRLSEAEIEAALANARRGPGTQASLSELPEFENRLIDEIMLRLEAKNVRVISGIKEQITELLNVHGLAATEEDVKRIVGAGLLLPDMTPAQAEALAGYAKRIASTPLDSFERAMQTLELFSYVHDQLKPYDLVDVAFGLWYANVLSSLITSARNVTGNAGMLFLDQAAETIFRNPAAYWPYLEQMLKAAETGVETAAPQAANTARTGQEGLQRNLVMDDERRQGVLESKTAPMETVRSISRVATRFLSIQDLLFANTAYEMKARQLAWDQANALVKAKKLKPEQVAEYVMRTLNHATDQIQTFKDRAETEWENLNPEIQATYQKANWIRRRVAELRLFERDKQLVARALDFAQKVTLDYPPEGLLGLLIGNLGNIFAKMENAAQDVQNKPARLFTKAMAKYGRTRILPFMRIPVNVFNRALDYGPVGYGRALMDSAGIPVLLATGKTRTRTAEERSDLLKRATLGTLAMLPLALFTRPPAPDDDPEDFPWLQIHGAGSGTPSTNLAQNGPKWRPYSLEVRVGGTKAFIDFRMAPVAPYLAAIGALHDRTRYGKAIDDKSALVQGWILAQALKEGFLSGSPVTSLRELSEAAAENNPMSERAVNRMLARGTTGVAANVGIPLAGLWRSLDQLAGGDRNTRDTYLAASMAEIPVASRLNLPSIDVLGDPLTNRAGMGWIADFETMESPEARIYRVFAEKDISPTDLTPYQSKLTPEQFYFFAKARGAYLKDYLLTPDADGKTGLERLQKLSDARPSKDADSPAKKYLQRVSLAATRRALYDLGQLEDPEAGKQPD